MSYGPSGDGSTRRQPCYKSREHVWLLRLQAWPPRRGQALPADQSSRKLSALPFLNYPLGSQSQGPENASSICSPLDMIPRHVRPCTGDLVTGGAKPPVRPPHGALRKAAFLRLRGHAVLPCRRSAGGVFPEQWHGKACRAAFKVLCCSRRLCFIYLFICFSRVFLMR